MIDFIKEKSSSLSKAISRIAKAYPLSTHCASLSLIAGQINEYTVALKEITPESLEFTSIMECLEKAFTELEHIEKEGIIPKINLTVLRKNFEHFKELLSRYAHNQSRITSRITHSKEALHNDSAHNVSENTHLRNQESALTPRQEAIVALFANQPNQTLQLRDVMARFPDVSDRTLRFDLAELVRIGKVTQRGFGRGSFYRSNNKE